jgi:hypothetical protein
LDACVAVGKTFQVDEALGLKILEPGEAPYAKVQRRPKGSFRAIFIRAIFKGMRVAI